MDLDEGMDRLRAVLADLGGQPLEELLDDVAIVAVRTHPEDRPRPAEAGPNRLPPGVD